MHEDLHPKSLDRIHFFRRFDELYARLIAHT
jgi:hypothetical protein